MACVAPRQVRQRQVTALTTPLLKRALDDTSKTVADQRDRALILIGMAGALRRSELVALEVSDLNLPRRRACGLLSSVPKEINLVRVRQLQSSALILASVQSPILKPTWNGAGIFEGRVFRAIDRHGNISAGMTDQSVALIVKKASRSGQSWRRLFRSQPTRGICYTGS